MSANPRNFLTRLAHRALGAPAVRPRLASRFETPRVCPGDAGMEADRLGYMQGGVQPVTGMQDSSRDAFRRSAAVGDELSAQAGDPPGAMRFGELMADAQVRSDGATAHARLDGSLAHIDSRAFLPNEASASRDAEERRLDAAPALRDSNARLSEVLALRDAQGRRLDGVLTAQGALQSSQQALQEALNARDQLSHNPSAAFPDERADKVLLLEARPQTSMEGAEASTVRLHRQALERLVAAAVASPAISADEPRTPSSVSQTIAAGSRATESAVAPIEIVIGRIEIHASEVETPRQLSRAPKTPPAATLPLAEYLRRREGRGP